MDAKFNYQLIELAREARQYTQKDVASMISFSQSKLSKAEKGQQNLSEQEIEELAQIYDYPKSFFYQKSDSAPVSHLYFRRRLSLSAKVIDSFIANTRIYKKAIDELMDSVDMPEYDLGSYSTELNTPQEIAQKIRFILRINKGPVYNLTTLLEKHGILIAKIDFGTDKIDGLSSITDSGYKIIFLNSKMPNDRMRFSLAHELGHMLMHLDYPPKYSDETEREADDFASEFLMPQNEILPTLHSLTFQKLGDLKRYWLVSMRAIVRRAKNLGLIDDRQYRNLQIDFSRYGYTKKEPIVLPAELPSVVPDIIDLYKSELDYTDQDLMDTMYINRSDYQKWFGKPKLISLSLNCLSR
ncbi:MAG: ImmA/IrrE family metallo-endopeptidase [Tannerellaceae bacterium]|jgi:Zn-dependent peptidase ImmA (M78 family)/DNA-binding XRE family transcriptional regulator|nr:ImmA/IrrE family metallo-endopeptidase [Tannerellaceae bacterium]